MTFRDLQKLIESQPQVNPKHARAFQRIRDKAFWYWDAASHKGKDRTYGGDCYFNHIIGFPKKDGIKKPMFDYELMLYKALLFKGYSDININVNVNATSVWV